MCSSQFESLRSTNACVVPMLHACKHLHVFSFLELLHRKYGLQERAPKLGTELTFMSSFGRPPHWDSIINAHLQFRPQTCRKPVKFKKIRYISVINKKSVIFKKSKIDFISTGSVPVSLQPMATFPHAYFRLYMLSTKRNKYFTS